MYHAAILERLDYHHDPFHGRSWITVMILMFHVCQPSIHAFPKPITYTARGSSATAAPLMRSELGPARLSSSMIHASSSYFWYHNPLRVCYVQCTWSPSVIVMATFQLSSFLGEERCPLERLHWQVARSYSLRERPGICH